MNGENMKPTRLDKIGLAGKADLRNSNGILKNSGDWATRTIAFKPALVATTNVQSTGIRVGPGLALNSIFYIETAGAGTTPTITVGTTSSPAAFSNATDISVTTGFLPATSPTSVVDANEEVVYSFGSADIVDFDGEIVVTFIERTA